VDDTLVAAGVISYSGAGTLTHISFAQWNDGAGTFYVDNVESPPGASTLIEESDFGDVVDSDDLRDKDVPEYMVIQTDDVSSGNVVADGLRISHADNPPEEIRADFRANVRSGPPPLTVEFRNQSSGDLTGRLWNCGDGFTNDTRDTLEHVYNTPGTYTVTLTVSGPLGSDTRTKTGYIVVGGETPLRAEFSASNREGQVPHDVSFRDRSSGNIVSWSWDFDNDGTEDSTEQSPTHIYYTPGLHTVSLTVTDGSDGHTETKEYFVRSLVGLEKNIDNVDYPKTHFGSKTILFRSELEIPKEDLKYTRLFYNSCNTGNYYLDTFSHGLVYYTLNLSDAALSNPYLKAYLEGKNNQEIWELLQSIDPVYDYYDFSKTPSEQ